MPLHYIVDRFRNLRVLPTLPLYHLMKLRE
ncbi:MAG: hypothetical protein PWP72_827 [Thermoanaerobacter sp.]|jgi:hypothetical protein|nr:hypothetical protein [Thermoanaerobacter sp.]